MERDTKKSFPLRSQYTLFFPLSNCGENGGRRFLVKLHVDFRVVNSHWTAASEDGKEDCSKPGAYVAVRAPLECPDDMTSKYRCPEFFLSIRIKGRLLKNVSLRDSM